MGELSSKARQRGCCSLIGNSPKSPTTPPLPLRGAPPPEGAARKAPLKGELAAPTGLTEGFRGRYLRFYETLGEYAQFLGSPMGELSSKARLRGAAGTCIFLVVRRIRTNHFLLPFNAPFKKEVLRWPSQSGPLGLPAPPLGEPGGPLRIRLGAFQMIFCVPPETPPARCAVLSPALSGCTPSRTATPAKPFRGGFLGSPMGELAARKG